MTQTTPVRVGSAIVCLFAIACVYACAAHADAAELITLTPDNYRDIAPQGKEVDGAFGDYLLRNEHVTAVVASPYHVTGRSAQRWATLNVAGCVIDLTTRDKPNDQLFAIFAPAIRYQHDAPQSQDDFPADDWVYTGDRARSGKGKSVTLKMDGFQIDRGRSLPEIEAMPPALRGDPKPWADVQYQLEDGWKHICMAVSYHNPTPKPAAAPTAVSHRVDPAMQQGTALDGKLLWRADPHWRQAYGILSHTTDKSVTIAPGKTVTLLYDLIPGETKDDVLRVAHELLGEQYEAAATSEVDTRDAVLSAVITDGTGNPIPAKVTVVGVDGTTTPNFGPVTAESGVLNVLYTANGRIERRLAPGTYDITITRGPEYAVHRQRVTLKHLKAAEVHRVTLKRIVDTTGWISADFHNHSTESNLSERFWVMGYYKNRATDGESWASQRGRVLNLLAEHIEFAVPTEHNRASSYKDDLAALGAQAFMATADGAGMTSGRRHSQTHQNVFPVTHIPGMLDGGMLQRPEHITLISWFRTKVPGGDTALMVIQQPAGKPLLARRQMDVFDVEHLTPIIDGKPETGHDNRILEWIRLLNMGYRLPAVVNSGAWNNHNETARVRNYIASPTDDPARVKTEDVVRETRAGHVIMTTGPFMAVTATSNSTNKPAMPFDEIVSKDGKVTLHVRAGSADSPGIEAINVLINGTRNDSAVQLLESDDPMVTQFAVDLDDDAHLIVVASGSKNEVAVANPIFVDVNGDGYSPHSPFDDKLRCWFKFDRPVLAKKGADPGLVTLIIENHGKVSATDTVSLRFARMSDEYQYSAPIEEDFPGDIHDVFEVVGENVKEFTVDAGARTYVTFPVRYRDAFLDRGLPANIVSYVGGSEKVRVPRSGVGPGRNAASQSIAVDHYLAQLLEPVTDADDVDAALADAQTFTARRSTELANFRFALAGDKLLLSANVSDKDPKQAARPREGSCVEIFSAIPEERFEGRPEIGHMVIQPAIDGKPATVFEEQGGKLVPLEGVDVSSSVSESGYVINAVVPLDMFHVDISKGLIRLEFQAWAADRTGRRQRLTCFRSGAPHIDCLQFGRLRLQQRVRAELAMQQPLAIEADGKPASVHLKLTNESNDVVRDTVTLELDPVASAAVDGEASLSFSLKPGEAVEHTFTLRTKPNAKASFVTAYLPLSERRLVTRRVELPIPVMGRSMKRFAAVDDVKHIKALLADVTPHTISAEGITTASVRMAVAGDYLAIDAAMRDAQVMQHRRPWKGSAVEIFGAEVGSNKVGQVFLQPAADGEPAKGLVSEGKVQVVASDIKVASESTAEGYRLFALVPLKRLNLSADAQAIRLELQFDVMPDGAEKRVYPTLFDSELAYLHTDKYGYFNLVDAAAQE